MGFVALIGKPNVGKSTLLNRIVGQRVSIVSDKAQTTRRKVIGIATTPDYQIAFLDTPGVHEPHTRLGRAMLDAGRSALDEADVVVAVVDASHHPGAMDERIAQMIGELARAKPVVLCLNKMDVLKADNVERNVAAYTKLFGVDDGMLTTATRGHNVDLLVRLIVDRLPERPPVFEEDAFTDQSTRFMVAEIIREKILRASRQEIPHATAVVVEAWDEEPEITRIEATIVVEKPSQRAILIGKHGAFLRRIGTEARAEIEELLGRHAYLGLHVKVQEDWRMSERVLNEMEYER
ncbi:MAG: GTPase Era [Fimbriimonas ginsengisoli]|uniref:GTPase Era n=1 Tax=Fimbriimonas ginsengisoli TaxID=1005039 RepID=A0A931LQY9_FIMGI|nr:GTPase Era [Fimbriimonas ginsengisoli]